MKPSDFDPESFLEFSRRLAAKDSSSNQLPHVAPPRPDDIVRLSAPGTVEACWFSARGKKAIDEGALAFCVMAGGMATRMGGVVKALVDVLPEQTFLDVRLEENAAYGSSVPLWIMTSDATDSAVRSALHERKRPDVATFRQNTSFRFTPEGQVFVDSDGTPSTYSTGHGDLVDALRRSRLLDDFIAKGGRYVWIANIDNVGASIDPAILGAFESSNADVLVEVCAKRPGDRGGIPVRVPNPRGGDHVEIVEEFRLPKTFDPASVDVFNTNTFLVKAEALRNHPFTWSYFQVNKTVEGRPAVQFERLLQEITASLQSVFVEVPRESRFIPIKDNADLAARRGDIEALLRSRTQIGRAA